MPLAPGSRSVVGNSFATAVALRHYNDAANIIKRERAMDPVAPAQILHTAVLAEKLGDSVAVARAVRELRARGGRLGASDGELLRNGGAALQNELATGSLASFGPGSRPDSVKLHAETT